MDKRGVLKELREIKARVTVLIQALEAEEAAVTATLGEVRRMAILEEVYRAGGHVSARQISDFARKYGRDPSACGGYYSGKVPSLAVSGDGQHRNLTQAGREIVEDTRDAWGEDWLDRLPMDIVGNPHASGSEISF